jgi:Papain family cysteine protease
MPPTKKATPVTSKRSTSARSRSQEPRASEGRILNCMPSPDTEKDWQFHNAMDAGILTAPTRALPDGVDLRDETWWPIGDQGSTGSCVGWASAAAILRWHLVQAGRLPKTEPLSPRFQWMAAKETDEFTSQPTTFIESAGTSLKAALDVARKFGSVRVSDLDFETGHLYTGEVATFYAIASQFKISAYFNLGRNLRDWRTWLAKHGPILTRLDVDETWDRATVTKGKLTTYKPATARGGHAVCLVGYTAKTFIVRNSWGSGWGDKGYAYASDAYAQKAFTESYGVAI